MYKFGCIGIGNMGGAVAQALVQAAGGGSLMVSSRTREKAEAAAAGRVNVQRSASTVRRAAPRCICFMVYVPPLLRCPAPDICSR